MWLNQIECDGTLYTLYWKTHFMFVTENNVTLNFSKYILG